MEMDRAIKHGAVSPDAVVQKIDWDLLDCSETFENCFYLEFTPSDIGGCHRSVFVGGLAPGSQLYRKPELGDQRDGIPIVCW